MKLFAWVALVSQVAAENVSESARSLLSPRFKSTPSFNVKDYGAVGDGKKDDTVNIQKAFDAWMSEGHGHLEFPAGNYRCGPISFRGLKDSTIEFQSGAELFMLDDRKKFAEYSTDKAWFRGEDCNNLEIKGGKFHGNSHAWQKLGKKNDDRPEMFDLHKMQNFKMHGANLLDSAAGHIHIVGSSDVNVYDLTFDTDTQDNSDGLTLDDVERATVENVNIRNYDDCLKIAGKTSNVVFKHCSCHGGHGLSVGGGSKTLEAEHITWSDIHLLGMQNGARVKVTKDTKGFARDITWEKLRMVNVRTPMNIETDYGSPGSKKHMKDFTFGDLYFSDIKATYDPKQDLGSGKDHAGDPHGTEAAGYLMCDENAQCKKLHLTDVNIETDVQWECDHAKATIKNVSPKVSQHNCLGGNDLEVV